MRDLLIVVAILVPPFALVVSVFLKGREHRAEAARLREGGEG